MPVAPISEKLGLTSAPITVELDIMETLRLDCALFVLLDALLVLWEIRLLVVLVKL